METNNFQRIGSRSNAQVGKDFERAAHAFLERQGILGLTPDFLVYVGFSQQKTREFDLGSLEPPVIVECKSHTWTKGDKVPSAKIAVWKESMFYFHIAPKEYRKIFFVLKSMRKKESLANYFIRTDGHLIPPGVEIWEYDEIGSIGKCIYPAVSLGM